MRRPGRAWRRPAGRTERRPVSRALRPELLWLRRRQAPARDRSGPSRAGRRAMRRQPSWRSRSEFRGRRSDRARDCVRSATPRRRSHARRRPRCRWSAGSRHWAPAPGCRRRAPRPRPGRRDWPGVELVVLVGRRHGDHVRIGGRIERRRFRPGIAGGGDQHAPFSCAFFIASCSIGSYGPAKLILMTRAPLLIAHSSPARMCWWSPAAIARPPG